MFRVGIIGTDNSHALGFAQLCNIPDENGKYAYDDVRIVAIHGCGDDPEHTKEVAEQGNIPFIAQSTDEFIGKVDAVMVVARHGSKHIPEILPFIEKGYPVWIDKPIASSIKDIEILREACKKHNTLLTGGTTLKYATDVVSAAERVKSGHFGKVLGGSLNYPADLESEYDGIYFYGPHIVEIMLTIFGYDVKSVIATSVSNQQTSIIAKYDNFTVTLNMIYSFTDYFITIIGDEKTYSLPLIGTNIYKKGFDQFVYMLRTKQMPLEFEELVKPIYVLDAITKSLEQNCEIEVKCCD